MLLEERLVVLEDNYMRIKVTTKKDEWSRTEKWLTKHKTFNQIESILEKYGREGIAALAAATPIDSGETASSWEYKTNWEKDSISLEFVNNSKTSTGIPIVILLHYGHGNGRGAYIKGRDFINPIVQPIFDKIVDEVWKEIVE